MFVKADKDEAGRDVAVVVVVEQLSNGTSRTALWREFELLARVTYKYRGARRPFRRVAKESFANGKAVARLEIE